MAATPAKTAPSSPRLARILREAGWILFLAIGAYLVLALGTYHKSDPGPYFSGSGAPVANRAGAVGEWLADGLLYVFGLSAWWWVALAAWGVLRLYARVETWDVINRRSLAVSLAGFVVLVASSSALEAMRLHSLKAALPLAPGGVLGEVLSGPATAGLGFTGATLVLVALIAASFSVFSGLSWIRLAEKVGAGVEWAHLSARTPRTTTAIPSRTMAARPSTVMWTGPRPT